MTAPNDALLGPGAASAVGPVAGALATAGGALVGSIGSDVAGAVLRSIVGAVVGSVASVGVKVADALAVDPTAALPTGFTGAWEAMAVVGRVLVAPLLFIATASAVLRRDAQRLVRAWSAVPLAAVATFGAVAVVRTCCHATDGLASLVVDQMHQGDPSVAMADLVARVGFVSTGLGPAVGGLVAAVTLLALFVLWLELALRGAAIVVVAYFLPLVFATAVWPALVGVTRRAVEVLAALIVSKLLIIAALVLGVSVLDHARDASADVIGLGILLLTAFCPMAMLRLVPVVEAAAIGHLEGRARQPLRALEAAPARAQAAMGAGSALMGRVSRSGASQFGAPGEGRATPGGTAPSMGSPSDVAASSPAATPSTAAGSGVSAPSPTGAPGAAPAAQSERTAEAAGSPSGVATWAGGAHVSWGGGDPYDDPLGGARPASGDGQ